MRRLSGSTEEHKTSKQNNGYTAVGYSFHPSWDRILTVKIESFDQFRIEHNFHSIYVHSQEVVLQQAKLS